MRFEIYGHACLKVVEGEGALVVDPWLVGSCYWRSWWHFPAIETPIEEILGNVRFIYLTHQHWDHFHNPSLRMFPRDVFVLVAETPHPRIKEQVRALGFGRVVELPHARPVRLNTGLEVTSYQFGEGNDSALVVTNGRTTILNLNDCKARGAALRQIQQRHPRPDFMLMSHSNAAGYPYCYTTASPAEGRLRDRSDYLEEFAYMGHVLRPRYAVPFASNHCYLHPETIEFNHYVTSPLEVQERYATYRIPGSECVVMTSGDSWDKSEGFRVGEHPELRDREGTVERYRARHAEVIRETVEREAAATLPFAAFERYFLRHMGQIPRLLRRLFPGIYVFEVPNDALPFWVVDFGRGTINRLACEPQHYHLRYRIPVAVLRDCVVDDMWATFAPSKRYRAHITKGALRYRFFFFVTMDLVANGFLPLRRNLNLRALRILFARRRELYVYLGMAWRLLFWRGGGSRLRALYPRKLDRATKTGPA